MSRPWTSQRAPWLIAACMSGLVATWLAGSERFHVYDADSLVPKLTSTMHWSFYYWHTARNGQLIALMAMPFKHPLANLVVQQWLGTFAGVMAIYLLVAFAIRKRPWFAPGTVAVASFLVGSTEYGHNLFLEGSQTYGTSMALLIGGVCIAQRARLRPGDAARLLTAAALMLVGAWVNLMAALFACAVVAIDGLVNDGDPSIRTDPLPRQPLALRWFAGVGVTLGLLVSCLAAVMVLTRLLVPSELVGQVTLAPVALADYPHMIATLASRVAGVIVSPGGATLVMAAVIGATWLWRQRAWPRALTVTAAAGIGFFMVVTGMKWVAINECHPRYILPSIIAIYGCVGIVLVASVGEVMRPFTDSARLSIIGRYACAAAVPAALLFGYGLPEAGAARRAVDRIGSPLAEQVVESGVGFVAGDYWTLWPVVFRANLILHDRGDARRVWGFGGRARVTRPSWEAKVGEGTATFANLARTPDPSRHDLGWIARHLDIEIGEQEESIGDLDLYRFRLGPDRTSGH